MQIPVWDTSVIVLSPSCWALNTLSFSLLEIQASLEPAHSGSIRSGEKPRCFVGIISIKFLLLFQMLCSNHFQLVAPPSVQPGVG
jgi:hypothetical protein